MIVVYVIRDSNLGINYVGITKDVNKRIKQHESGQSKYTRRFKNFSLIYTEDCSDYNEARKREKFLKSGQGRTFIKKIVEAGLPAEAK